MLKKLVALAIVVISLFGYGFCELFLKLKQWQIQSTISQQIKLHVPKGQLHHFVASHGKDGVNKFDKEFEYNGEMYDVVFSDTTGDQINYYCFKDSDDSNFFERLNKLVERHMFARHNRMGKILKKLINAFVSDDFFSKAFLPQNATLNLVGALKYWSSCLYQFDRINEISQPPENFLG